MTTINLEINIANATLLKNNDKENLSFLVSRVFEEYIEDLQDKKLSKQIQNSRELDNLISKIKM